MIGLYMSDPVYHLFEHLGFADGRASYSNLSRINQQTYMHDYNIKVSYKAHCNLCSAVYDLSGSQQVTDGCSLMALVL
jgi:hypothetical protein